jgi:hypothetical protein
LLVAGTEVGPAAAAFPARAGGAADQSRCHQYVPEQIHSA